MHLLGWWKHRIKSCSQVRSAVSYTWGSGVPSADWIARPELATRHCQNKKTCHVLREVWNKTGLKQEAEVFFFSCTCQVHLHMEFLAATCVDFPRKHFPSVILTCERNPGDSTPIPEMEPLFVFTVFSKPFIKEVGRRRKK